MFAMHDEDEEDIYDEWGHHSTSTVLVDFLLPTGIFIPMDVERNSTIEYIKTSLWDEACRYPLFGELKNPEMYVFMYVTCLGTTEEIVTESRRLSEIDLRQEIPMLKLVKRQGDIAQKKITQEIKILAGIKNDDEINKDPEKSSFRRKMRQRAAQAVGDREKLHWKKLLEHHYPPTIEPELNEQFYFLREFGLVKVYYEQYDGLDLIKVNPKWHSDDLIREAVRMCHDKGVPLPTNNPEDYVLKGSLSEYIVGDYELCDYKALRKYLIRKVHGNDNSYPETAQLQLLHVKPVRPLLSHSTYGFETVKLDDIPPVVGKRHNTKSVWTSDSTFNVTVVRTGNINLNLDKKKLVVHIGLVHGMESLCNACYTSSPQDGGGAEQQWNEVLHFDITIQNLPRNVRLCIAICSIDKKDIKRMPKQNDKQSKTKKNDKKLVSMAAQYSAATPLFWVNMNVFDYLGVLKNGKHKLTCWQWPDNMEKDSLNLRGVGVCRTEDDGPFIEISLEHSGPLEYPSYEEVMAEAARILLSNYEILQSAPKSHIQQLHQYLENPSVDQDEEEKALLWKLRMECRDHYPERLSRLLSSVNWSSRTHVVQMQSLLSSWPHIEPDYALMLLDCHYADPQVRKFAVNCLRSVKADQLQQYLLQLVQVIKYEPYIDNPLVTFLLERAWDNRKIGHYLFWHLKSELSNPFVSGRFTLILEAYLFGNISHIDCLHAQHNALLKMKSLNELVKSPQIKQNEVNKYGKNALLSCMKQESYSNALSDIECPLNPGIILEKALTDKCKVMRSKMRPLWLVFKNSNLATNKVSVIYKNGDDLRQDMLTLQIISIMDSLWKSEGLDLRMIPYGCLSTGDKQGMIEVVTQANTIANIQREKAGKFRAAFRHESLFDWIKSKNETPEALETAIQNFTYSCAGYCVATYVLGVGDRHSDNVMVTERGQLFHIDFGHILGNFKTKLGIKRERVPFVLAHDFIHVINKGKTDTKEEFLKFRKLCDSAFKLLRSRGNLFIALFSLMLSSGLPELTSEDDLKYLHYSLALSETEAVAEKRFRNKFDKALKDSWATSINWFFHNVNVADG